MKRFVKSKIIVCIMLLVMTVSASGCGAMIYPERRGQGTTGKIDPAILALDCFWLLIFVIPGVIALVVDFTTGGMYYEDGSTINIKPGDPMAFRLRGHAPMKANLRVIVRKSGSEDIVATPFTKDLSVGQEISNPVTFVIPPDLPSGNYELALEVNNREAGHWRFDVAQ